MDYIEIQIKARQPFEPVGTAAETWTDFLIWWQVRWPDRPIPCTHGLHNLCDLTNLSAGQLTQLLEKRTPANLLPKSSIPAPVLKK